MTPDYSSHLKLLSIPLEKDDWYNYVIIHAQPKTPGERQAISRLYIKTVRLFYSDHFLFKHEFIFDKMLEMELSELFFILTGEAVEAPEVQ